MLLSTQLTRPGILIPQNPVLKTAMSEKLVPLTAKKLKKSLPEVLKGFDCKIGELQHVVVGGAACLLHEIEITTFDMDLFFLVDADKLQDIKSKLSANFLCDWHSDNDFHDSHGVSISNLKFDFRLIGSRHAVFNNFYNNRNIIDLNGCSIYVRTLDQLISDARNAVVNSKRDGFEIERIPHFEQRAVLLERALAERMQD
jgi:hypothetical protein